MEQIHDPGGGGPPDHPGHIAATTANNDLSSMTPALGGDSVTSLPRRMRSFAEILYDDQQHRNILEVKLVRTSKNNESGENVKVKTLNEDDLSEFLFDVIKLKIEDCLGLALRTHRYDTKEIKLKHGVDSSPYLTSTPILFKGHQISIKKQMNNLTRVTFKNVPFNIPDEEIIHLCQIYGDPLKNQVHYEKPNTNTRGIAGSTRYVEMKMSQGKQFENYYWMEGPLSGDQGCRITVLHSGQMQQCSYCLRREDLCPGGGNGRACESLKTKRGRISDYMKYLRERHGYTSLKMEYTQGQFPALGARQDADQGFGHMVETVETDLEAAEIHGDTQVSKQQLSDMNVLQQKLVESEAKAKAEQSNARTALKKLEHVEKVASQRIVESMPLANFDEHSNHLAMLLATVLQKEDFEYDIATDKVEPRSASEFLKRIEENCGDIPDKSEKLDVIRNKVLEKMKRTLRRERSFSTSGSVCSISSRSSSKTRLRSEGDEAENETAPKVSKKLAQQQSQLPAPTAIIQK